MTIETLIKNAFLDDLRDDWVAVSTNGTPIARASDEASVRRAAPDAVHYLNAGMLAKHVDGIDDVGVADAAPEPEQNPAAAGLDAVVAQSADPAPAPVTDGSAFDGDGDGKVGGSKPRGRRAPAKK